MNTSASDASFASAQLARVAPCLDDATIHVWWLPYARSDGRASLKRVLGAYLDQPAQTIALVENAHGRPALTAPCDLHFNWSHSGDHAMLALARHLPQLGVDIELYRERPRALLLARRFFAPSEAAALEALPEAARSRAFCALWTAKEAVLKAHGRGLAYGLARVAFDLTENGATPRHFIGAIGPVQGWCWRSLRPQADLTGTLAWRGPARRVALYRADSV